MSLPDNVVSYDVIPRIRKDLAVLRHVRPTVGKAAEAEIRKLRRRLFLTEKRIEALVVLAEGCSKHSGFRAKRVSPGARSGCRRCNEMMEARLTLTAMEEGQR